MTKKSVLDLIEVLQRNGIHSLESLKNILVESSDSPPPPASEPELASVEISVKPQDFRQASDQGYARPIVAMLREYKGVLECSTKEMAEVFGTSKEKMEKILNMSLKVSKSRQYHMREIIKSYVISKKKSIDD